MLDPDTLYFSSEKYRDLLDVIGDRIRDEDLAQRKGNNIEASRHGLKVWDHLQELMKMLRAKSVFELDQGQAQFTIYRIGQVHLQMNYKMPVWRTNLSYRNNLIFVKIMWKCIVICSIKM